MNNFLDEFMMAFDITLLGLYQKKKKLEKKEVYSDTLKKGLDIFCYLNYKYGLVKEDGSYCFPTNETELIMAFENSMNQMFDSLPEMYRQELQNSKINQVEALVAIGNNNSYYLLQEAYELLARRELFKSKNSKKPVTEYLGQKIYQLMVSRNQTDYEKIRWFLQQRENVYISSNRIYQSSYQEQFINEYKEIVDLVYELLPSETKRIKICPVCGMVLRENEQKELNCVSIECKKQSKGFINAKVIELTDMQRPVMVLNDIVAHNIYYPGQLEIKIAKILDRNNVSYIKYPNMDEWDFEINFDNDEKWCIDAKVVENPFWIKLDIEEKENKEVKSMQHTKYVVPTTRTSTYLNSIRKSIRNKERIECITLKEFERQLVDQCNRGRQ